MLASREVSLSLLNPVANLTNQELRIAIAREVLGWENLRIDARGRITGEHPTIFTTFPMAVPDWLNSTDELEHLESVLIDRVGTDAYHRELGKIAGDFNCHPTPRQRCEAVLSAARTSRDSLIR
jgi:hypothetical protein